MTTKTQYRAICPLCFREQAVRGSIMVDHGYTRPQGWNANVGSCPGTNRPHFGTPEGRDVTATQIPQIRKWADEQDAKAVRAERGEITMMKKDRRGNKTPIDAKVAAASMRRDAEYARRDADTLEQRVAGWEPAEPREVPVEAKATKIHAIYTNAKGQEFRTTPACRSRRSKYPMITKNRDEVTCPDCLAIINKEKAE